MDIEAHKLRFFEEVLEKEGDVHLEVRLLSTMAADYKRRHRLDPTIYQTGWRFLYNEWRERRFEREIKRIIEDEK